MQNFSIEWLRVAEAFSTAEEPFWGDEGEVDKKFASYEGRMREHGLQGEARGEVREGSVEAHRTQVALRAEENRKIRYPQSQDRRFGEEGQGRQGLRLIGLFYITR